MKMFKHKTRHKHQSCSDNFLCSLKDGESALISDIIGGKSFMNKVESLGLRVGSKITKISSQMMHGPITINVGNTQIAIGYRMAHKIIIEREIDKNK